MVRANAQLLTLQTHLFITIENILICLKLNSGHVTYLLFLVFFGKINHLLELLAERKKNSLCY